MLIDISQPVTPRTAAFPGDVTFDCGWTAKRSEGSSANLMWARQSPHVGTHVDAPYHVDDEGARVGGLDLDAFIGRCEVVDATGRAELDVDLLRALDLRASPRVLFRTQQHTDPETFITEFPLLTDAAIAHLARERVQLVGIDAPSYDPVHSHELPIHRALGRVGIANVENLVLDRVRPGSYELLAQPLAWIEMDAAPLRAILRR